MERGIKAASMVFMVVTSLLTIYLGISVFRIVLPSSQHYALFICAVIFLSSLTEVEKVLRSGLAKGGLLFWVRLILTLSVLVVGTGSTFYLFIHAERLEIAQPFINNTDVVVGALIIVCVLILTFIQWGAAIAGFVALGVLYFLFGHLLANPILRHPEYNKYFLFSYLGMSGTTGIFWLARLAADNIFFIIIFSNILRAMNMVQLFIEIGKGSGRLVIGGATLPAIIGSGLTGMVTGETVSNVVLTGRFTIPTMIKYGYTPEFAGAVEATAGSSGQIMPPIMGLSAFIMAGFLNIPYVDVAKAAILPALLYLAGVTFSILARTRARGIGRLTEEVDRKLIFYLTPIFLIPFGTVVGLLLMYYSPSVAGLAGAAIALLLVPIQKKEYRPKLRDAWSQFNDGYVMLIALCLLLVAIGPLAQSVVTSNLNGRIAEVLSRILPNNIVIILVGTAIGCIILGMGSPTPVAYIMTVLIMGPFIQERGVPAFVAHFFIFYYATISALTPPVAPGAMAAAKISGGSYFVTGLHAFRLALTTLIIPFMFLFNPSLLAFPNISWKMLYWVLVTVLIQFLIVRAGFGFLFRHLGVWERVFFGLAAILGLCYSFYHVMYLLLLFAALTLGIFGWIVLRREKGRGTEAGIVAGR